MTLSWTPLELDGLNDREAEELIYREILSRNPEHKFEPSLTRVQRACELLGNPQHSYRVVHVAGTNGKTSTARMIESLVREHGLRTGLTTSPHLTTVRERIHIDGEPISRAAFRQAWLDVEPILATVDAESVAQSGPRMSFFEVLTVMSFAAFADAPVDVAVVEVGMGGTWDATNVVDPTVCVVTPISLDHQEWLGDSLADIAAEKAGIITAAVPVVIAPQTDVALEILESAAQSVGAEVWQTVHANDEWSDATDKAALEVISRVPGVGGQLVTLRTPAAEYHEVFVPLYGEHQAENALLALAATEALFGSTLSDPRALEGETVEAGFAQATSPGRLEVVRSSPLIIVDAAHNPAGAEATVSALEESFALDPAIGVIGILDGKDAEGILAALERYLDSVVITASNSPRAIPVEDLAATAHEVFGEDRVSISDDLPDALDKAVALAEARSDRGGGVVVLGSITLTAEARILLGAERRKGDAHSHD